MLDTHKYIEVYSRQTRDKHDSPIFDETIFDSSKDVSNIFCEGKEDIFSQLDFFLKNREWYNRKGIPYTFGLLLHGLPGCGKTSMIKAIANYCGRHIIIVPINKIKTCDEFSHVFFETTINSKKIPMDKRIYVFEDIDAMSSIVHDRDVKNASCDLSPEKNESYDVLTPNMMHDIVKSAIDRKKTFKVEPPQSNITLSHILNLIDGIQEMPGRIIIITTNKIDVLDKALIRPGRVDACIEFKKCRAIDVKNILEFFYEKSFENSFKDNVFTTAEVYSIIRSSPTNPDKCLKELTI